jgi:histidyl-tRNA synthetase
MDDQFTYAAEIAAECRAAGMSASVYPESAKIAKQIQYAASIGARKVAIVGTKEVGEGVITLKDLATGVQVVVPRGSLL